MFEQTFVPQANRTRSGGSLLVSLLTQVAVIGVLILIPLVYTEALPKTGSTVGLTAPPPPPPPPPPPAPKQEAVVKRPPRQIDLAGILRAPTKIPEKVATIIEDDMPPSTSVAGVVGSIPDGVPRGDSTIAGLIGP